ncbi:fasciclin domain-containing protein [Winogradskyella sp. DF17]|uniref:Fasciclin domain-containing protein n=1 Tax=Winogradskyella pelagia TaxID=2819984 RepID=A0ABS3T1V1_9FLAO|nr:fasciclin domain-containing protein [Winogradskyella sp. DF17]MBO3116728.1 fasciclin domain-containing protein [Winogradskyella sp. DF17]
MKIIAKTFKLLTVAFLVLGLTGCSDDDDLTVIPLENIIDIALGDDDLSDLVTALSRANLVDAVRNSNDITVLAPTNEAFDDFFLALDPTGNTTVDNVDVNALTPILLNHVITTRLPSVTISSEGAGYRNTLATGPNDENLSIFFELDDTNVFFNGDVLVENADIFATNGIVHKIDLVVELPTIGTFATTNPALEDLVAALGLADTAPNPSAEWINTVLNPEAGPFTVFAPTNEAFDSLLLELDPEGNTELGDLDPQLVDTVLTLHVVDQNVQSDQLESLDGVIPTLGGNLTLNGTVITDGLDRDSNILAANGLIDIQAVNGVVHVIDKVVRAPVE